MEENVIKELDTLMNMVRNWKKNYAGWVTPNGENEYVIKEFLDEIDMHINPYMQRLYACEYITQSESNEFMNECYGHVNELRDLIKEVETKQQPKKGIHA